LNEHLYRDDLKVISNAATAQVNVVQGKRLALEQSGGKRLSVLLAEDPAASCPEPATAGAGSVDYGRAHAQLDPAHAQRIISITDARDQGLIALEACQAYVREVNR